MLAYTFVKLLKAKFKLTEICDQESRNIFVAGAALQQHLQQKYCFWFQIKMQ
ncbi:hypothetical protein [Pseudanabaena sp. BC1403]|uniref:hypothetical protein n=1 Tax=Pseudanabaena sp. BC1403 TaxID=2043171 RepID=UPI0015E1B16A|nr:hypothetical protein [Pseudanabaena sp. BC1403]